MSKIYKLVVIGNGFVGKTTLLITYTQNKFPEDYLPTVFDNYLVEIPVDNQVIKMSLWDTAGQEEYGNIRPLAYPQTDIFLIVFSTIDRESFDAAVNKWYPEINKIQPKTHKMFVGTKIDSRKAVDQHV